MDGRTYIGDQRTFDTNMVSLSDESLEQVLTRLNLSTKNNAPGTSLRQVGIEMKD
jgi:hypothetical protein